MWSNEKRKFSLASVVGKRPFDTNIIKNRKSPEGRSLKSCSLAAFCYFKKALRNIRQVCCGAFHYRITGKDNDGKILLEGGTQNNRRIEIHEEYRYVENIFEELTGEQEWYYNKKTGILYVWFGKEDNLKR